MDLKTFVSETLTQIVDGVAEAQKRIADSGAQAAVNPENVSHESGQSFGRPAPVDFDVAVVAAEESSEASGGKAKASVGLISVITARAAAELESSNTGAHRNETTSRIKFTVMLAQPSVLNRRPPVRMPPPRPVV